jgi:hypothetical protein
MSPRISRRSSLAAHALVGAFWAAATLAVLCPAAHAQSELTQTRAQDRVHESARAGMFLPLSMAPRTDSQRAFVKSTAGYASLRRGAVVEGTVDVTLYGPIALRAGVDYGEHAGSAVRPGGGLRVQALSQDRQGVDMSIGAFYRPEGFTEAEGEIEAVIAFGRRIERWLLVANLVYGQDPEAAERDGEVRLGSLYEAVTHLHVGLDSRLRFDLGSQEEKRKQEGGVKYDLIVGPALSYSLPWICLIASGGVQGIGAQSFKAGVVALAGLGGSI